VIKALSDMPVPVIAVRGNTDLPVVDRLIDRYPNVSNAHLKKIAVKDRWFIGMGGTVPVPFRSRIRFREKRALQKAGALLNKTSVLVVHPPPWGTLDRVFGKFHAGSKGLLRLLDEAEPALCICGHIHEMPGYEHIGRTLVVNCSIGWRGAGSLIELSEDGAARAETIKG
jgi:Icc-related predicted phosphoesterase